MSSSSAAHVRIDLAPKGGFCIKSTTLAPAVLPPPPPSGPKNANLLEPTAPIPVPKGQKVFVNLAWDANVPPPPEGSEDAIQRAMQGEEVDEGNPAGWYVPVIVSNARQDKDKAGNPSLVFDCIFNASLKSRTLRDPEFKIFLIELSLQRIEAQTGLTLSRNIGTPNILSKGKLLPRTVSLPASMVPALTGAPSPSGSSNNKDANQPHSKKPLIEELSTSVTQAKDGSVPTSTSASSIAPSNTTTTRKADSSLPGLRGILKKSPAAASPAGTPSAAAATLTPAQLAELERTPLEWSWKKEDSGRLRIDVRVPGLALEHVQNSTLDIEPRRFLLTVPKRPTLDIDLALSDAEIAARVGGVYAQLPKPLSDEERHSRKQEETTRVLQLKRQRDFDVDGAEAEWRIGSDTVTIFL